MSPTRIILVVAAGSWLTGFTLTVAAPPSDEETDPIQNLVGSANSHELLENVSVLVGNASTEELHTLRQREHCTVSLHAAWETVRRTACDCKRIGTNGDDGRAHFDRRSLQRFLGFAEGRLGVAMPDWWQVAIGRASTDSNEHVTLFVPHSVLKREAPYFGVDGRVHAVSSIDVLRDEYGSFEVQSGRLSCKLPDEIVKRELSQLGKFEEIGLTAWMNSDLCVFGLHSWPSQEFTLYCVNRGSTELIWSVPVWGYFTGGISSAGLQHWVEIRQVDDTLYLFGLDSTLAYVEGVSLTDGSNLFRFTTGYDAANDPHSIER